MIEWHYAFDITNNPDGWKTVKLNDRVTHLTEALSHIKGLVTPDLAFTLTLVEHPDGPAILAKTRDGSWGLYVMVIKP